jgi:hypothetical protein
MVDKNDMVKFETISINNTIYNGKCWWCHKTADSNEHKIKKSVYDKFYGKGSYKKNLDKPVLIKKGKVLFLQSSKDKKLTFVKTLCTSCNNDKSSPFDLAFDIFLDYYLKNISMLIHEGFIDFKKVYGVDWLNSKFDLFRYFVKFFCGQISTGNYQISKEIIDFLNGNDALEHIKIDFQIKLSILDLIHAQNLLGMEYNHIYIGDTIYRGNKNGKLTLFNWFTINGLSVNMVYNLNIGKNLIFKPQELSSQYENIDLVDRDYSQSIVGKDIHELIKMFENSDVKQNDEFKLTIIKSILNK